MKRCPTCDKTFDDSMRFCQADGTPLVDAEPVDPYKTMVARPEDISAAIPPSAGSTPAEEDVLQLPDESDSRKTSYASEAEIRKEMDAADEQVIEIPPLNETAEPEPPKFSEPSLSPPSFGDLSSSEPGKPEDRFAQTSPPIPSPFGGSKPEPPKFEPPVREPEPEPERGAPEPQFKEPEPAFTPPPSPFDTPSSASPAEWTPPPAPEPAWQGQQIGQNTPFQPPAAGTTGQNKTLAIISLVLGIISFLCCNWFVVGIAAVITGFIAKGKAEKDPANFGGRGLAVGGIITGGISALLGLIFWVLYMMGFMASLLGSGMNF